MFGNHEYSLRKRNLTNYNDLHHGRKSYLHSKKDNPSLETPMESETLSKITRVQERKEHFGEKEAVITGKKELFVKLVRIPVKHENRQTLKNPQKLPEEANNITKETKSMKKRNIEIGVNAKTIIPERVDIIAVKKQGVSTSKLGRIPKKRVEEFDGAKTSTENRRPFSVGIMEALANEMKPDKKRLLTKPRSALESPAKKIKVEIVKTAAPNKLYEPKVGPELSSQIILSERKVPNIIMNNSMTTETSGEVRKDHTLSQEKTCPQEMDLETNTWCKPIIIPLENPDSPIYDFTSTPWPEPKGFTPLPLMSLDLSDFQSNINNEPLPSFPLLEPKVSTPLLLMSLDLSNIRANFNNKPLPSYPPRSSWKFQTRGPPPAMPRVGITKPYFHPRSPIPYTFGQLNSSNNQRYVNRGRFFRRGGCNNIY